MSTIKKISQWLLIPMILMSSTTSAFAFSDVEEGDRHYVAIQYLESLGVISGYEDGTFKSGQKINRAEALKMLTLATEGFTEEAFATLELSVDMEDPFIDTPRSEWYTKYLVGAKERGIISGYEDNSFKPGQNVKLVEALKIYLEAQPHVAYPASEEWLFADTPADSWFVKYTSYAASRGMLDVQLTNEIYPDQEMTRGYLAEIVYRKMRFKDGYNFGKATFYSAGLNGNGTQYKAAHRTLPFGTMVEVTNLANGKTVNVEINDRGPFGAGRVIDLSKGAFAAIASTSAGIVNVEYKVIQ